MDFGKQLKNARESKDLTLQQVSRELKINLNVLKKIEASEANELPNATSTKGFLKSYANHIDINPEPLIDDYLEKLQTKNVEVSDTVLNDAVDPTPFFLSDFIQKKVLPVVFLFVVLSVGFISYKYLSGADKFLTESFNFNTKKEAAVASNKDDDIEIVEKVEPAAEKVEKDSLTDEKTSETTLVQKKDEVKESPVAQVKPEEASSEALKPKDVRLIIEPLAKTYAYYKDQNNKKPITLSLQPNMKRSFTFKEAEITFLDSGAVNLILNGKDIGSPGLFAERKTIKFPSLEGL